MARGARSGSVEVISNVNAQRSVVRSIAWLDGFVPSSPRTQQNIYEGAEKCYANNHEQHADSRLSDCCAPEDARIGRRGVYPHDPFPRGEPKIAPLNSMVSGLCKNESERKQKQRTKESAEHKTTSHSHRLGARYHLTRPKISDRAN